MIGDNDHSCINLAGPIKSDHTYKKKKLKEAFKKTFLLLAATGASHTLQVSYETIPVTQTSR